MLGSNYSSPGRGLADALEYTSPMRLAWFTPWPPQASGVAGRSAEIVPALAATGAGIDVFVDERDVPVTRAEPRAVRPGEHRVQSAHDFVWRHELGQYDLAIYQVGNSRLHGFLWPYLFRFPGLAILHDARLHHARARASLAAGRADEYRAEFARQHPDVPAAAAELAVRGFDGVYYYQWPMVRSVIDASRAAASHVRGVAESLTAACPDRPVAYIALGGSVREPATAADRRDLLARLRADDTAAVFGVFGALTAAKRIEPIMRAFALALPRVPHARLCFVGGRDASIDIDALARALNVTNEVTVIDRPSDADFDRYLGAVDVLLQLRWPSSGETSGPWLSGLSAGRPSVITDLADHVHVPAIDPQSWQTAPGSHASEPVAVAVDVLDEEHSLRLAIVRLATDAELRGRLGAAARRYWEVEHSVKRSVDDYRRVITSVPAATPPAIGWPFTADSSRHFNDLLAEMPMVARPTQL